MKIFGLRIEKDSANKYPSSQASFPKISYSPGQIIHEMDDTGARMRREIADLYKIQNDLTYDELLKLEKMYLEVRNRMYKLRLLKKVAE